MPGQFSRHERGLSLFCMICSHWLSPLMVNTWKEHFRANKYQDSCIRGYCLLSCLILVYHAPEGVKVTGVGKYGESPMLFPQDKNVYWNLMGDGFIPFSPEPAFSPSFLDVYLIHDWCWNLLLEHCQFGGFDLGSIYKTQEEMIPCSLVILSFINIWLWAIWSLLFHNRGKVWWVQWGLCVSSLCSAHPRTTNPVSKTPTWSADKHSKKDHPRKHNVLHSIAPPWDYCNPFTNVLCSEPAPCFQDNGPNIWKLHVLTDAICPQWGA